MKWFCLFLTLCKPFTGGCQHTYDTLTNHLLFKVEASCYLFSFFPYAGMEIEIPLSKNSALTCNGGPVVGLAVPAFINGKTASHRNGFVLNPGIKKYIFRNKFGNNQIFTSVDYFYRDCSFHSNEKFVSTLTGTAYEEDIQVRHKAMGFTINLGQMLYFGNFGFEFTAGLGAIFMRHRYSDKTFPDDSFENDQLPWYWLREKYWTIRAPVRTRIFYRF